VMVTGVPSRNARGRSHKPFDVRDAPAVAAVTVRVETSGSGSSAVVIGAQRGRLPEVRTKAGKLRYRRANVYALLRRGLRRRTRGQAATS
jgi:hypothetical protein